MKKVLKAARIQRMRTVPTLGVLLAGLLSLGAGASASASEVGVKAHPSDCHYEIAGKWGTVARCEKDNGGSYRASGTCKFPNGKLQEMAGPWKWTGPSYAYCPGDSKAVSAGITTRPTR
ncbi:hypothetical protein GCM10027074_78610 [Streptomyces deserti]